MAERVGASRREAPGPAARPVTIGVLPLALALGAAALGEDATPVAEVTFAGEIAAVLYAECVGCHRPGGSAPFSLLTYENARQRADRIAAVTASRTMPPWLPDSDGELVGERRLSDGEIDLLGRWARDGAPPGDLAAAPRPPEVVAGWRLGAPELVIEFPEYTVPAGGRDIFRNLVAPASVDRTRYVSAVELRPGDARVVHHAVMTVDTTESSRARDLEDAGPGFDGMQQHGNAASPDGHFLGWTPGRGARPPLEGLAWRVDPGTDFVLQLHLRPSGHEERVRPSVGLHFADRPPEHRPVLLVVESALIDIPAGASEHRVSSSYELPVGVDVLSVYPHAHYLGKELRGYAALPDGRYRQLIRIPRWDFDWQEEYRYVEPVRLPAGTVLHLDFTFDNSSGNPRNPNDPPRRVVYGLDSTDEMAQLILQLLPHDPSERDELLADARRHHRAQSISYMAVQETTLGDRRLEAGDPQAAIGHYRRAMQYRLDHPAALAGLARALLAGGDPESTRFVAERAVEVTRRQNPSALATLAEAYAALGDRRALPTGREALRLATSQGQTELADSIAARLPRYPGSGG